jgi:transcriptional regulator with XRE-family HTH domain
MTVSPYTNYKTLSVNRYVVGSAVFVAFAVGTGGYSTPQCFISRSSKGYSEERIVTAQSVNAVATRNEGLAAPSQAKDLKLIRDYFKPSVAQLAASLGVERQTIYNWQAGKGVTDERREVIRELASACSKLVEIGIAAGDDILRRKISNGQTLLQLIASGTPAGEAVVLANSIIEVEKNERQFLAEHLRRRVMGTIDTTDSGKPHLNEEG